ncbi:hypothetical protein DFH29DRAFT_903253 [Suillus ampliporus]|nr:hypothetical protein DFH29DRAFT_903253 [Suillus ampliporus]
MDRMQLDSVRWTVIIMLIIVSVHRSITADLHNIRKWWPPLQHQRCQRTSSKSFWQCSKWRATVRMTSSSCSAGSFGIRRSPFLIWPSSALFSGCPDDNSACTNRPGGRVANNTVQPIESRIQVRREEVAI